MARPTRQRPSPSSSDRFNELDAAVLTEYRGLTVKQLQDLRSSLRGNATYAVVKNTLTKLAAKEAGVDRFDDLLVGPTAIAFINGDAVEAAKGLRDFAKANPHLVIKGGVLDGKALDAPRRSPSSRTSSPARSSSPSWPAPCTRRSARRSTSSPLRSRRPLARRRAAGQGRDARVRLQAGARADAAGADRGPADETPEDRARGRGHPRRRRGWRRRADLTARLTTNTPLTAYRRTERTPSWRSSAPTSSLTPSRR